MKTFSFRVLLCTLFFSPLAFGSSELWSQTLVVILISLMAISYGLSLQGKKERLYQIPGVTPLCLLLLFYILQLVPFPLKFLEFLSPALYEVYAPHISLLGKQQLVCLSLNPKGTLMLLLTLAGYVVFYGVVVQLLVDGEKLKKCVWFIIILSTIIAFFAIIQNFYSPDYLLGFRATPENALSFGPWTNRNQYSGYMVMVLPVMIALFLFYQPVFDEEDSFRLKIATYFSMAGTGRQLFLGLGTIVIVTSLFLCLSRGGIVTLTLTLLFFFLFLLLKKKRKMGWPVMAIVGCILLGATWAGMDQVLIRFDNIVYEFGGDGGARIGRVPLWQDTYEIIKNFFPLGTGFGSFVDIYPSYKTLDEPALYTHAHNDYLQILCEGGLLGFLLAGWFAFSVMRHGWQKIGRRNDYYSILLCIGTLSGIISMFIFSTTDFNLHNGANGLLFFFLCGLLVSAGNTRFHYSSLGTLLPQYKKSLRQLILIAGVLLFTAGISIGGGSFLAQKELRSVKDIYISPKLAKRHLINLEETYEKASRFDPYESLYNYLLGDVLEHFSDPQSALRQYSLASIKKPLNGVYLQRIAMVLDSDKQHLVKELMETGYKRGKEKDELMLSYAEWLLQQGDKAEAMVILREGIERNSRMATRAAPLFQVYGLSLMEISELLPGSVDVWVRYGVYLQRMNRLEESEFYLKGALQFLENEKVVQHTWFNHVYEMYKRKNDREKMLETLLLGVEQLPNYIYFRKWLSDYYTKEGIYYRAVEELRQALIINPLDKEVREKLSELEELGGVGTGSSANQ